jgi:glycerol uptake facilitator-like aquaporin
MRRVEFIAGCLIWLAAAILMPMAALEPVQAAHTAPAVTAGLW